VDVGGWQGRSGATADDAGAAPAGLQGPVAAGTAVADAGAADRQPAGTGPPVDPAAVEAWSDPKDDERHEEAKRAQDLTSQAEKAAAKECGRDVEGRVGLGDVAAGCWC